MPSADVLPLRIEVKIMGVVRMTSNKEYEIKTKSVPMTMQKVTKKCRNYEMELIIYPIAVRMYALLINFNIT